MCLVARLTSFRLGHPQSISPFEHHLCAPFFVFLYIIMLLPHGEFVFLYLLN